MELTASRDELHTALAPAARIARAGDSGMPILNCVLVRVADGRVSVRATDLVTSIVAHIQVDGAPSNGDFAIVAKDLAQAIASAPGPKVSLKASAGWLEIKSGKARWKLPTLHAQDFPKVAEPTERGTEVSAAHLAVLIDCTAYAASKDDARANMRGIWYQHDGSTGTVAATDGHRLSLVKFTATGPKVPKGVIIPSKSLGEIAKLVSGEESCSLAIAKGSLFVTCGDRTVATKLIDLDFPPIGTLTESALGTATKHVLASKAALVGSIKRVAPATTETRGIVLRSDGDSLLLRAADAEGREIADALEVESLPDLATSVNAKYLLDAVNCIAGDHVRLRFGGEIDPIVITTRDDDSQLCIVMPMRID